MWFKSTLIVIAILSLFAMTGCGSTSTPDLKLIAILYCGDDQGACDVSDDNSCRGSGRWNPLREDADIQIADNGNKVFEKHEMGPGNYDSATSTCTFSEDITMKSSARYRITIGDLGPFDITKTTLENQKWIATLEFNN